MAKQAGVSDRTIRRWLDDPSFADDLGRLRGARFAARALLAPVLQPVDPDEVTARLVYMRGAAGENQKQKKVNHGELMRGLLSDLSS